MEFIRETITKDDGRVFIVGDIHGYYTELMQQLTALGFDFNTDLLIGVGDLVDRGPESEFCLELPFQSWFKSVRGNHEQMMFDAVINGAMATLWYGNGGNWFHYSTNLDHVIDRIENLPPLLPHTITLRRKGKTYGIVHADIALDDWFDDVPPEDIDVVASEALWSRSRIKGKSMPMVTGVDRIFVGHSPVEDVKILGRHWYIDTGMCFDGKLTIVEV